MTFSISFSPKLDFRKIIEQLSNNKFTEELNFTISAKGIEILGVDFERRCVPRVFLSATLCLAFHLQPQEPEQTVLFSVSSADMLAKLKHNRKKLENTIVMSNVVAVTVTPPPASTKNNDGQNKDAHEDEKVCRIRFDFVSEKPKLLQPTTTTTTIAAQGQAQTQDGAEASTHTKKSLPSTFLTPLTWGKHHNSLQQRWSELMVDAPYSFVSLPSTELHRGVAALATLTAPDVTLRLCSRGFQMDAEQLGFGKGRQIALPLYNPDSPQDDVIITMSNAHRTLLPSPPPPLSRSITAHKNDNQAAEEDDDGQVCKSIPARTLFVLSQLYHVAPRVECGLASGFPLRFLYLLSGGGSTDRFTANDTSSVLIFA